MNIIRHELRTGIKPFLLWTLGLFFLDFAGLVKFTGIAGAGNADIMELMDRFPRIVLAVFGMVGLDISSLGGYYAILAFYALICVSIYSIYLGTGAVNREAVDKTYEFLFTKPRTRKFILGMKLIANVLYLAAYCIVHIVFSITGVLSLKIDGNINSQMVLFGIAAFFVGILFFSLGAFLSAALKRSEKGVRYSNLCFLGAFLSGILYDMLDDGKVLQILSPLKYFLPADLLKNQLNPFYTVLCIILSGILLCGAFKMFDRREFSAAG